MPNQFLLLDRERRLPRLRETAGIDCCVKASLLSSGNDNDDDTFERF